MLDMKELLCQHGCGTINDNGERLIDNWFWPALITTLSTLMFIPPNQNNN